MKERKVQQAPHDWRVVDEGWGRRAVDFATLAEPMACREYVAMHQHLGVGAGDRVLDIACGSGLAAELAGVRGASCAGIDASERLVAVARDRNPEADIRAGDMHALPWEDDSFDVVTSFRGIWGTTPEAVAEVLRVLAPGGRLGITVWGHVKRSPGFWAFAPFSLASEEKVDNQANMVFLGRPGEGEALLAEMGFVDIQRVEIPFRLEYADPDHYARAIGATGPAFEAIQDVGEDAFLESTRTNAAEHARDGLPLRADLPLVGYLARKPESSSTGSAGVEGKVQLASGAGFLQVPASSPDVQRIYDDDIEGLGYVMNATRLWAQQPPALDAISSLMGQAVDAGSLTFRQRGILVAACASSMGDSYCSLAWGKKLAGVAGEALAAGVIRGDDESLDPSEQALATWARQVSRDPSVTTASDVQALRDAGFDEHQIFGITLFVALRLAFSTVNDALGAQPDRELGDEVPTAIQDAVTFGRPIVGG